MMKQNEQTIQSYLQRISNILLINGGFLDNIGLYTGEMGLVLFFFKYARYAGNELFKDYGFELIEKIQQRIYKELPIDYKKGLSGIGSAIEYLVQEGFIEADTDEVLEEFDNRLFYTFNLPLLTITEIIDIGHYAIWRFAGSNTKKELFQKTIFPQIDKIRHNHLLPPLWLQLRGKTISNSWTEKTLSHCKQLIEENKFWNKEIGFQDGLAGWGMTLLTELDGDKSWFSLFPEGFNNERK